MEGGMQLDVEISAAMALYLVRGMRDSGVATSEQAAEILDAAASGLERLGRGMREKYPEAPEAADYCRRVETMAKSLQGGATAIRAE